MNIDTFLTHHGLQTNPFVAEEARHDPVFERMSGGAVEHPDFAKILGSIGEPAAAVVFGEKGSGKTALRLTIGRRVDQHNAAHPDAFTILVAYDDLNPVLDRIMQRKHRGQAIGELSDRAVAAALQKVRLEDHQDAILSLAITQLVDALVGDGHRREQAELSDDAARTPFTRAVAKRLRRASRHQRANMAVLAALYDQPRSGSVVRRFAALRARLGLGRLSPRPWTALLGFASAIVVGALSAAHYVMTAPPPWLIPAACLAGAAALLLWGRWLWRFGWLWRLTRRIRRQVVVVDRKSAQLRRLLSQLRQSDLAGQPWPLPGEQDSRYQLTARLLTALGTAGCQGMMVLVDRVDEPTAVHGRPDRMQPVVWPMLDNKFLQQPGCGLKMLLPLELRDILFKQSSSFFQQARLDKQSMIDRLEWSGVTLYDLCTHRLRACQSPPAHAAAAGASSAMKLTDLFEPDVGQQMLVEALDHMRQPRDAFKFLYTLIQEHCRSVREDEARFNIPRLLVDGIRRRHAQRVADLTRGVSPT